MRPDQEHVARTLASVVLEGLHGDTPTPGMRETIMPTLSLDIRGIVRGMSRKVMIDSAEIARMMSEEWERQAEAIDLGAMIRDEVRRQIEETKRDLAAFAITSTRQSPQRSASGSASSP